MRIFIRAFRDTRRQLGGWPGLFMAFGGGFAGWLWVGVISGPKVMGAEWQFAQAALAGVGVIALSVLVFNLICAPYRMATERSKDWEEKALSSEDRIKALELDIENERAKKPAIKMRIEQCFSADFAEGRANEYLFGLQITVSNSGTPSALDSWELELTLPDGSVIDVPLQHRFGAINLMLDTGAVRFSQESLIYMRASEPISSGAIIGGILVGTLPGKQGNRAGWKVVVRCRDVTGNPIESSLVMDGPGEPDKMRFIPHSKGIESR